MLLVADTQRQQACVVNSVPSPKYEQVPQHSSKDGSEYSLTLYSIFLLQCLVTIIHIKLCLTTIILMCNICGEKGLFSS